MALISRGGGSKKTTTSTKKTTTTTKKTTPTTTKKTTTSTPKKTTVSKPANTSSAYNQATYTPPKTTTTTKKTNTSKNTSSAYNQATYTPPKTTTTPKPATPTYKPQTSPSYTPPKVTVPKIEVKPTPQVPSTANNSAVNNTKRVMGVAGGGILTPIDTPSLPSNNSGSSAMTYDEKIKLLDQMAANSASYTGIGNKIGVQNPGSFKGFTPITNFTTDANGNPNTPDQRVISNAINNTPSTAKKGNATIDEVYQAQNYYNDVIKPSLQFNNNSQLNNNGGNTEQSLVQSQSFYDDLMAAFLEMNEAARQEAIDAILKNLDAVTGTYKDQIQQTIDEYAKLVNQNEVAKDRARRVVKENQANRGQLDSGMGRQERLNLDIGYDNKTADLNLARQQAVNEIYNLIAQAEAEAAANKASVNNQYDNAILQWQIANS